MQRFQDAAERYGCIVVGSNNERNGPVAFANDALRAMVPSWSDLNEAATADMEAGRFARATAMLELMGRMRPESAGVDYRLARIFARAGNKNAAVQALRNAARKGLGEAAAIEAEADFEPLRGVEGFRELLRSLKSANHGAKENGRRATEPKPRRGRPSRPEQDSDLSARTRRSTCG